MFSIFRKRKVASAPAPIAQVTWTPAETIPDMPNIPDITPVWVECCSNGRCHLCK